MQRPSWNSLKEKWGNLFFFDGLSLFLSRIHEERTKAIAGVILFDPYERPLPPNYPPLYVLVIYKDEIDFLKNNLKLRNLDHDGIIEPIGYGIETFKKMIRKNNPLAKASLINGIVLYELNSGLRELEIL
ncbi:MAG: hypothetical protein N2257_07970 [Thermodesulfovibrionales bacterium]|nr:hypothetical protein [Thermodesulfovibrionales bacterium]